MRLAIALLLLAAVAEASCIQPSEEGRWANGAARLELRFVCQDVVINGQLQPPGAPWYVTSELGEVPARQLANGQIYAVFDRGFAKQHVFAKMSAYRPGQLWVYTFTDFADPARADEGTHEWFTPAR